ncbi:MAG: PLP-dependent aminotransferase family protein [Candidatus Cloacimonetes bacterium]|nr:PLP-dependent aminotransferase family protein [Candidatus Cloacimonadota bacterium]
MVSDFYGLLSDNALGMKRSAIRELLKLTRDPEIISFAGGLPAPETFPVDQLKEVMDWVMTHEAQLALQYGPTEGDMLLRELIVKNYSAFGYEITPDNVLITTASQQGLDLLAKLMCNRGDKIIVGKPTYLGGLGAFNSYGPEMIGVSLDEHGMNAAELEKALADLKKNGERAKFIYVIPDFQNPTGITMPDERRRRIIELAYEYDTLIVEDSPYHELRFEGEHQTPLYALDNNGQVITLGTFSKIFCPGFRIGWVIADPQILDKFIVAKQQVDLCTAPFNQRIAARFIERGYLGTKIKEIIEIYRVKRDTMLQAFEEYMPEGVHWTRPEGGLFLFITLPEYMDSEALAKEAIKEKVAFVPGNVFFHDNSNRHTMRINFSFASKDKNLEGVKRLANVIRKAMKK